MKRNPIIINLNEALPYFEGIVKGIDQHGRPFLINGRLPHQKPNKIETTSGDYFNMRPIEARGNRLICAVMSKLSGESFTFKEDDGDGTIIHINSGISMKTEHTSTVKYTREKAGKKNSTNYQEEVIVNAINKKINKQYADSKNTLLIVFFDGIGKWYRNIVREGIQSFETFKRIYTISLLGSSPTYDYAITEYTKEASMTFKITIHEDWKNWDISQLE